MRAAARLACFALNSAAYVALLALVRALLGGTAWRRERALLAARWGRETLRIFGLRLAWEGPRPEPGALLAANHLSYLDIPAVLAGVPAECVAKSEVAAWPLLGAMARAGGSIFIRRGSAAGARAAAEAIGARLRDGARVLVFPEGTSTRGDRAPRVHGALLQPALEAGAPLYALTLDYPGWRRAASYAEDDRLAAHLWRTAAGPGGCVRIQCERVSAGESRRAAAGRLEALFRERLGL